MRECTFSFRLNLFYSYSDSNASLLRKGFISIAFLLFTQCPVDIVTDLIRTQNCAYISLDRLRKSPFTVDTRISRNRRPFRGFISRSPNIVMPSCRPTLGQPQFRISTSLTHPKDTISANSTLPKPCLLVGLALDPKTVPNLQTKNTRTCPVAPLPSQNPTTSRKATNLDCG